MYYVIYMRDKSQIRISESDYNNISNFLGKIKLFRLSDGQIVNAVDISRISPATGEEQEVISSQYRIKEPPQMEEGDTNRQLEKVWNDLRKKGMFSGFNSYQEYTRFQALHKST